MNAAVKASLRCWAAVLALCGLAAFLWWQNNGLQLTHTVISAPVSEGVRIVHLSDLHGSFFGLRQERLARLVRAQEPDVIVLTGDYVDIRSDEMAFRVLLEVLTGIAPVYCVTGNHEALEHINDMDQYHRILQVAEDAGALLSGETVYLTDEISLTGAEDVYFTGGLDKYPRYLEKLGATAEGTYRLLLSHRPEMFDYYAAAGFDLIFCGHAHGGQIRLPVVGGLYAPGQGVLPEYTSGWYAHESGTQMVVNRGLGNSVFPLRLFNRPEVGVIEIVAEGA